MPQNSTPKDTEPAKNRKNGASNFMRYMGLSFQLFTIIGMGTYLGWVIQQRSEIKFPVWILVFCFFSVFIAFYHLWISVKKDM